MHAADVGLIVVNQAYAALRERRLEEDFLVDFAAHRGQIRLAGRVGVGGGDMPANADRTQAVQSRLSLCLAPLVMKHLALAAEDAIRNQLLVAGVGLGFVPRSIGG